MGRVKTALIKRTAKQFVDKTSDSFSENFEENKKAIRGLISSKRMKNMIAGHITRIKKNTHKLIREEKTNE